MGLAIGFPLAALFASGFGGPGLRLDSLATAKDDVIARAVAGALLGLFVGVATCMAGSAFILLNATSKVRATVREETSVEPTVKDRALGQIYPGVFGSSDPYEPMRRRIEREEPDAAEATAARVGPAPTACLVCGRALDVKDEPDLRFRYFCGAELT